MSTLITRTIQTPDGQPVAFPNGIRIGSATGAGTINNIGVAGQQGVGVGIAPIMPSGMAKLYGTEDHGLPLNVCDIKAFNFFASVADANAVGYALHRAFYNGGSIRPGFFIDKYLVSKNGSIASSLKNGVVLTSATRGGLANSPFSSVGAPDAFHGAFAVAKTRGSSFFPATKFMHGALALLANAHASAASGTTYCAWYSSGSTNFPKGNNNNALGDTNDASIAYTWDGNATYAGCGKTGSANFFAKTTHNGQNCGVADLNGLVWEISPIGLTSNGSNYFLLNTAVDVATITSGVSLATDAWGATGLAAMYTDIGATYGPLTASSSNKIFGNAAQVLSEATSGTPWAMAGAGIPLLGGVGGSNQFGSDYMYDARPNDLCPIVGGSWGSSSAAGVWAVDCSDSRGHSHVYYGGRSALYL